jgi:hypothetical protein
MSLDALAGSATDNSYLTLAEAEAIALTRPGVLTWSAVATTDAQKEAALTTGSGYLNQLGWIGTRTSPTQPMAWPRTGVACAEKTYDDATIPSEVEQATFDIAEALLNDPGLLTGQGGTSAGGGAELVPGVPNADLQSLKLDVMELVWKRDQMSSARLKTVLTELPHLVGLLGCLTTSTTGGRCTVLRVRS